MRFWMCLVVIVIVTLVHGSPSSDGKPLLQTTPPRFGYLENSEEKSPGLRITFDVGVHRPVNWISGLVLLGFSGSYFYDLDASASDEK